MITKIPKQELCEIQFIVGNSATPIGGKVLNDQESDKFNWTAFVRIHNEKLSPHIHKLIQKVEFGLNTDYRTLVTHVTITSEMK